MPIPHQEMRRIIKRRIQGLAGRERIRVLQACLDELPAYYSGPYGELRHWVHTLIEASQERMGVQHQDTYFLARQGAAQVVLVGPPNAGKSSLLHALTGRDVAIGDYPFTTLRPVEGMVAVHGAQIQLVDLPGLITGAAAGKGGGRAVLAAVRVAQAMLFVMPLTESGLEDILPVLREIREAGIALPAGLVATKADLATSTEAWDILRQAFGDLPAVVCSVTDSTGLEDVRELIWTVSGLIRVYVKPKGRAVASDPVVLAPGSAVHDLVRALNRGWVERFQSARVTGASTRFPHQAVGLDHPLMDGDVVELTLG